MMSAFRYAFKTNWDHELRGVLGQRWTPHTGYYCEDPAKKVLEGVFSLPRSLPRSLPPFVPPLHSGAASSGPWICKVRNGNSRCGR